MLCVLVEIFQVFGLGLWLTYMQDKFRGKLISNPKEHLHCIGHSEYDGVHTGGKTKV